MANGPIDALLNSLYDCSGLGLRLLALTRKLNFVESKEAATDTLCSTEFVESVIELTESELSLAGNGTP
jgi:hypothetical protein